ncbi:DUF6069 family protein [Halomarina salina]|uniref:DUF6069 family protein n=1 Tax=Halomarina salina TaxID=1872699 RepID=A0ABD5RRD2_9EURY|nr:DUF6069 family protein [Halomarina salina]
MSTRTPTSPDASTRTHLGSGALARRGIAAAVLGLLLTAVTRLVAVALDSSLADVQQFAWGPVVGVTLVAALGATLVYAVFDRFTDRPDRWFLVAAAAVFLVMLAPLTLGAESLDLTTNAQVGLVGLHLAAAVGIAAGILGSDRVARDRTVSR